MFSERKIKSLKCYNAKLMVVWKSCIDLYRSLRLAEPNSNQVLRNTNTDYAFLGASSLLPVSLLERAPHSPEREGNIERALSKP